MLYFRLFCKRNFKTLWYIFARLDEKHICLGNFEKILKIFDENSIENCIFIYFLGNFVAKNRNFGNNIIFLQQFFSDSGGGVEPPLPPCVGHWPRPGTTSIPLWIWLFAEASLQIWISFLRKFQKYFWLSSKIFFNLRLLKNFENWWGLIRWISYPENFLPVFSQILSKKIFCLQENQIKVRVKLLPENYLNPQNFA